MNTNRLTYFDALKGFSIVLVVFCHHVVLSADSIAGNIMMSFAWAAVPCFFMVTGGLLHKAKQFSWKKHIQRISKIYVTLMIWKLLYLLFYTSFQEVSVDLLGIIKYLFFMGEIANVDIGPMWFMSAYLQALLFYPVTYYLRSDEAGKKVLMYLCLLLWATSLFSKALSPYLALDSFWGLAPFGGYKNMLFYFILGSFLFDYKEKIQNFLSESMVRRCIPWLLVVLGIAGAVLFKYSYTGSFMWNGIYLDDGYNRLSTMVMAVGLYLVFVMDFFPRANGLLAKLGKHTMGVYYLHYPILVLLNQWTHANIPNYQEYYSFGLNLAQTFVVVAVCLVITMVAKKIPVVRDVFQ